MFDDVEVLDFCGPFEVFSAVRLNEEKRREEPSPFKVILIAETADAITTTGGMKVLPHCTFQTCPHLDILVVPGGWGTRKQLNNPVLLDWLRAQNTKVELLTSVCTGSMVLGFAGLLDGLHATTHWRSLDWMRDSFPSVSVEYRKHFVQDGRVFTSAGISAGIDMSLKVVAHCFGEQIARATARHMEYPYPENDTRRIHLGSEVPRSLGLVALVVRDYDEAIAFFTSALRFSLVEDTPLGGGKRWVVMAPSQSHGTCLLLARAATPEQLAHVGNQTGGRVFLFLHTSDIWADYRHMQSQGVKFVEPPREEPYGMVTVFFDLYGNKWDLIQRKTA